MEFFRESQKLRFLNEIESKVFFDLIYKLDLAEISEINCGPPKIKPKKEFGIKGKSIGGYNPKTREIYINSEIVDQYMSMKNMEERNTDPEIKKIFHKRAERLIFTIEGSCRHETIHALRQRLCPELKKERNWRIANRLKLEEALAEFGKVTTSELYNFIPFRDIIDKLKERIYFDEGNKDQLCGYLLGHLAAFGLYENNNKLEVVREIIVEKNLKKLERKMEELGYRGFQVCDEEIKNDPILLKFLEKNVKNFQII